MAVEERPRKGNEMIGNEAFVDGAVLVGLTCWRGGGLPTPSAGDNRPMSTSSSRRRDLPIRLASTAAPPHGQLDIIQANEPLHDGAAQRRQVHRWHDIRLHSSVGYAGGENCALLDPGNRQDRSAPQAYGAYNRTPRTAAPTAGSMAEPTPPSPPSPPPWCWRPWRRCNGLRQPPTRMTTEVDGKTSGGVHERRVH